MLNLKDITESDIAKARLSREEAMVVRVYCKLPTAGKRTKRWVNSLSPEKRMFFLRSGKEKLVEFIS